MSRIGNKPITIPKEVKVTILKDKLIVTGPKGELSQTLPNQKLSIKTDNDQLLVTRKDNQRQTKAFHGMIRSLVFNMVIGVTEGYEKRLELVGTGYRVKKEGDKLTITVGYSHPVEVTSKADISLEVEGNNKIIIRGINKQKVGQTAAEIRAIRKPEPYKGKGIRYQGEIVRRKAGKAAKAVEA